eukprot:TRINITY_DN1608_c1_g1_i2.p1 TRINITY_DN1608_c1_g1~~TRINITY_DN1608_c1_g1_i2.p1  ORF type:complete len:326 (+),score=36.90 TRINITY_DN1608_c1_g1_i2:911-1888(+)
MFQLQTLSDEEMAPLMRVVTPKKASPALDMSLADEAESSRQALVRPPLSLQIKELAKREAKMYVRDKTAFFAGLIMGIVLVALTSLIFFRVGKEWGDDNDQDDILQAVTDHRQAVTFIALTCMFQAAQPVLLSFPNQRPVFLRESTSGTYSTFAYVMAKSIVEIPTHMATSVSAVLTSYFLIGLNGTFPYLVLNVALLCYVSASTSLLLACAVTNANTAVNMLPATFVPQIMFSGFFVALESIPVWMRWIQYICPLRYSVSTILAIEFTPQHVPTDRIDVVTEILSNDNVNRDLWYWYVIMMVGFLFLFRIIAAVILTQRGKKFQ